MPHDQTDFIRILDDFPQRSKKLETTVDWIGFRDVIEKPRVNRPRDSERIDERIDLVSLLEAAAGAVSEADILRGDPL